MSNLTPRIVNIPLKLVPPYEAAAILLAEVAYPAEDEHAKRLSARYAICNLALRQAADEHPAWALLEHSIRPIHVVQPEPQVRNIVAGVARRLDDRQKAGIIAGILICQQLLFEIPPGIKQRVSLNKLAWLFGHKKNSDNTNNIKHRVVYKSYPVLHLGIALTGFYANQQNNRWNINDLLHNIVFNHDFTEQLLANADMFGKHMNRAGPLKNASRQLTLFKLM